MMKKWICLLAAAVLILSLPLNALAAVKNQVVEAGYAKVSGYNDGVSVSKKLTPVKVGGNPLENYFDIELTVEVVEETMKKYTGYSTEIAVVMDVSNTMNAKLQGDDSRTRMDLAREGLVSFVDSIARQNPNRVYFTLVVFNTNATRVVNEYLITSNDVKDASTGIQKTIRGLTASVDGQSSTAGYADSHARFTNIEGGLQMAYNNLRQNPKEHQYVVLMSDGFPTTYNTIAGDQALASIGGYDPYTTESRTLKKYGDSYISYGFDGVQAPSSTKVLTPSNSAYSDSYYGWRGYFADAPQKELTPYGTSYSDWGAYYAQRLALHMKGMYTDKTSDASKPIGAINPSNSNRINIFAMGVDLGVQTVDGYQNQASKGTNVVDLMYATDVTKYAYPPLKNADVGTAYGHMIGSGSGTDSVNNMTYENWLGYVIAGGQDYNKIYGENGENVKAYYSLNNGTGVTMPYQQIWNVIETIGYQRIIDTMFSSDPMGEGVEFIGFYDKSGALVGSSLSGISDNNGENTAAYVSGSDTVNWTLADSGYAESQTTVDGKTTTVRTYRITYRVRLENEKSSFVEADTVTDKSDIYATNGSAKLSYRVDTDESTTDTREVTFPEPSVKGYLGQFSFTKQDEDSGKPLQNVSFTLKHNWNCPVCTAGKGSSTVVAIPDMVRQSDASGVVSFEGIPSGHQYTMYETMPDGYGAATEAHQWPVEVTFDSSIVTANGQDYTDPTASQLIITNEPQYAMTHVQFSGVKHVENLDGFGADKFLFRFTLDALEGSEKKDVSFELVSGSVPDQNAPDHETFVYNPPSFESPGSSADIPFPKVHVFGPGTYVLNVEEIKENSYGYAADPNRISYTADSYRIEFTVSDYLVPGEPEHRLRVTGLKLYKNGSATAVKELFNPNGLSNADHDLIDKELVFNNVHKVTGFFFHKKDANTREPLAGVTFTLEHACSRCGYVIDPISAVSDANGRVTFDEIPVDHQYRLIETKPVGYEPIAPVLITVDKDGKVSDGAYTSTGDMGIVYNTPKFYKTAITFGGQKYVNGEVGFPKQMFTFELYEKQTDGSWKFVESIPNGVGDVAEYQFRFHDIVIDKLGTYTYKVVEQKGTNPYMDYDPAEYVVVVKVAQGELYTEHDHFMFDISYELYKDGQPVALERPGSGINVAMHTEFNNAYFLPAQVPIQVRKLFDGAAPKQDQKFTFILTDEATGMETSKENNGETVDFGMFTFEEPGVYTYTVKEKVGEDYGIIYDESEFKIIISVRPQVTPGVYTGQMVAEVTYERNGLPYTEENVPVYRNITRPPVTGDSTPVALLAGCMLMAASGLMLLLRKRTRASR